MATYREIEPIEYAPDSPATSAWAAAVSNNLNAVIEGDPTAPPLLLEVFKQPVAGSGYVIGGFNQFDLSFSTSAGEAAEREVSKYAVVPGSVRLSVSHNSLGVGTEHSLFILRNGSVLQSWNGSGTRTIDVTFARGDQITVRTAYGQAGSGGRSVTIGYARILSNIPTLALI